MSTNFEMCVSVKANPNWIKANPNLYVEVLSKLNRAFETGFCEDFDELISSNTYNWSGDVEEQIKTTLTECYQIAKHPSLKELNITTDIIWLEQAPTDSFDFTDIGGKSET